MRLTAALLLLVVVALGAIAWWGQYTVTGRNCYDEIAGPSRSAPRYWQASCPSWPCGVRLAQRPPASPAAAPVTDARLEATANSQSEPPITISTRLEPVQAQGHTGEKQG